MKKGQIKLTWVISSYGYKIVFFLMFLGQTKHTYDLKGVLYFVINLFLFRLFNVIMVFRIHFCDRLVTEFSYSAEGLK